MLYKTKKSRSAIPGYTLIPQGDHYKARKIGITGERVKNDPAYKITRMHNEAFKKAAGLGKLIRSALLPGTGIKNKPAPLTAALLKILADNTAPFHKRSFDTANFTTITGFNLNPETAWKDCMDLEVDMLLNPAEKKITVYMPGFIPYETIRAPEPITHARITISIVFIDPVNQEVEKHEVKTTIIPLKRMVVNPLMGVAIANKKKEGIWLIAMGAVWYQKNKKDSSLTASKMPGPLTIVRMGSL